MDVKYDMTSYIRVLKLATTPTREEFSQISLIAGAGILLVGFMGFLIYAVMTIIPGGV
jgi:protein transport protein SEC61 subunit gamma-like protein